MGQPAIPRAETPKPLALGPNVTSHLIDFRRDSPPVTLCRMKLKSLPDDFEVEELSDFRLGTGPFAVYMLTKRSLGTPEAITAVADR